MKNKLFLLLFCLSLLISCAQKQERKALKRIQSSCQNLMGCTEEDVVLELGAPQKIQTFGELQVFEYYKSYGTRTDRNYYTSHGVWCTSGQDRQWEAFDKIEIFFKNDLVMSWKSSVKR